MWNYIVFVFISVLIIIFSSSGFAKNGKTKQKNKLPNKLNQNCDSLNKDSVKYFNRQEIEEKLKTIENTPVFQDQNMAAMCYSRMLTECAVYYICPKCGAKTLYEIKEPIQTLTDFKRELTKIEGIHVKIDESDMCRSCSPDVKYPYLGIWIKVEGDSDYVLKKPIHPQVVFLLRDFLKGKYCATDDNNEEMPIIEGIEYLKWLLGFPNTHVPLKRLEDDE